LRSAIGDNGGMQPGLQRIGLRLRVALVACVAAAIALPAIAGTASKPRKAATAQTAPAPSAALLQRAEDVAIFALGLIGVDYRFGGNTPQDGLDCSGLVRYVFAQTTGIALPRTSAQMGHVGARVARPDLVPGDLVFFNTRHFVNSHVGIYLGENRFVHAPSRGSEVTIASLDDAYWKKRFEGGRRLVGVLRDNALPPASDMALEAADAGAAAPSALATLLTEVSVTP
jgi:cell wall-associated NlpC family hydrolase